MVASSNSTVGLSGSGRYGVMSLSDRKNLIKQARFSNNHLSLLNKEVWKKGIVASFFDMLEFLSYEHYSISLSAEESQKAVMQRCVDRGINDRVAEMTKGEALKTKLKLAEVAKKGQSLFTPSRKAQGEEQGNDGNESDRLSEQGDEDEDELVSPRKRASLVNSIDDENALRRARQMMTESKSSITRHGTLFQSVEFLDYLTAITLPEYEAERQKGVKNVRYKVVFKGETLFLMLESESKKADRNTAWAVLMHSLKDLPSRVYKHIKTGDVYGLFELVTNMYSDSDGLHSTKIRNLHKEMSELSWKRGESFDLFSARFQAILVEMDTLGTTLDERVVNSNLVRALHEVSNVMPNDPLARVWANIIVTNDVIAMKPLEVLKVISESLKRMGSYASSSSFSSSSLDTNGGGGGGD